MKIKIILTSLVLSSLVLGACSSLTTATGAADLEEPNLLPGSYSDNNSAPEPSQVMVPTAQEPPENSSGDLSYAIVDTGQDHCYDTNSSISCPGEGEPFYGQDAQYQGLESIYLDNGDGTVTDLQTGLMWQKSPDLENKVSYREAAADAVSFDLAGFDDWRLPTIKELYSLIDFNGSSQRGLPYLDQDYFDFEFGDQNQGERLIDAQYWSSTEYVGTTMDGNFTVFGVNFADGRIKGYPGDRMLGFVRYVRGNPEYGKNQFADNLDGTISDLATDLIWQQADSGQAMNWEAGLGYCADLELAGENDWRMPNAKELQSLVDYSRSPQTTGTAAINPLFLVSEVESWYWSSTTHLDHGMNNAVYLAFGQAYGLPDGNLIDVHGAGAQRSDPKAGDAGEYSAGRGSAGQEDQVRIENYVRCVRGGVDQSISTGGDLDPYQGQIGPGSVSLQELAAERMSAPPEAINACLNLAPDQTCSFTTPGGDQLAGTCLQNPQDQLVCVPDPE